MEVPQSSVIDKVTLPAVLEVQTIVKVCQIRFLQSVIENPRVRQRRNRTGQIVQKTDEMSLVQSVGTSCLFAERSVPNSQKDPENDRSPARVEHRAGRECHRSMLVARMVEMPQLTREDR